MVDQVKDEATGTRPSCLSGWYRKKLGRDVAISDIDWIITSISNKDVNSRYLVVEEKTITKSNRLLIGLGQAISLKEFKEDIVRVKIPILVVFIENENLSEGAWVYKFNPKHVKKNRCKVGNSWYIDVKEYSNHLNEEELVSLLLGSVGSKKR